MNERSIKSLFSYQTQPKKQTTKTQVHSTRRNEKSSRKTKFSLQHKLTWQIQLPGLKRNESKYENFNEKIFEIRKFSFSVWPLVEEENFFVTKIYSRDVLSGKISA